MKYLEFIVKVIIALAMLGFLLYTVAIFTFGSSLVWFLPAVLYIVFCIITAYKLISPRIESRRSDPALEHKDAPTYLGPVKHPDLLLFLTIIGIFIAIAVFIAGLHDSNDFLKPAY